MGRPTRAVLTLALTLGATEANAASNGEGIDAVAPSLSKAGLPPQYYAGNLLRKPFRDQLLDGLRTWEDTENSGLQNMTIAIPLDGPGYLTSSASPSTPTPKEPFNWTMAIPQMSAYVLNEARGLATPMGIRAFAVPELRAPLTTDDEGSWSGPAHRVLGGDRDCVRFPDLTPPAEGIRVEHAEGVVCSGETLNYMNPTDYPPNKATEVQWTRVSAYEKGSKEDYRVDGGISWVGGRVDMKYTADIDLEGVTTLKVSVDLPETACREANSFPSFVDWVQRSPSLQKTFNRAGISSFEEVDFRNNPDAYLGLLRETSYEAVAFQSGRQNCAPEQYQTSFSTDPEASLVTLAKYVMGDL